MNTIKRYLGLALPFLMLAKNFADASNEAAAAILSDIIDLVNQLLGLPPDITVIGQARGYREIKLFCDNIINNIEDIIDSTMTNDEKREAAGAQNVLLYDSGKVYQAQKGSDAAYLAGAKAQAKMLLDSI